MTDDPTETSGLIPEEPPPLDELDSLPDDDPDADDEIPADPEADEDE